MPRSARIDYPGALHHIIARGLNKQSIFLDDIDRDLFLHRLGTILTMTETPCYAWALMPNHVHLVLSTAEEPISTVMQKLLTGHAINFNKRHDRCGHLFQNRFKSILCEEDAYLLELLRYIHLNPLKGELVKDLGSLEEYPYCGHGAVLGRCSISWQDTRYVLRLFHHERPEARRRYLSFIKAGLSEGKRADLVEGNLVRRKGEWSLVEPRNGTSFRGGNERILGDDDFIGSVLKQSKEVRAREQRLPAQGYDFNTVVKQVAAWFGLEPAKVLASGRSSQVTKARSVLCFIVTSEGGMSQTRLARDLGLSQSTISRAIKRGRNLAMAEGFSLHFEP